MRTKIALFLARRLVLLYPSRWRGRDAEEALDLLAVARPPGAMSATSCSMPSIPTCFLL